jgi:hypothetical protein
MSRQPDYISFEPKGRDELLSQIGSFSPAERSLFHHLCDAWAPSIDAGSFLRTAGTNIEQEHAVLERLMGKLRSAQLGVLTTKDGESGEEHDRIILTSKGSIDYWVAIVEQAIRKLLRTGHRLLPSEERLSRNKALPPDYHIVDADSSQLVAAYGGESGDASIFRIRLMGDFRIIFTPATARPLILRALAVLKQDLTERGIMEELARIMDTSITEIARKTASKAPDVWLELTKTLVKERSTIAFRKNFEESDELFQLGYLVMVYVDSQIGVARRQKENEQILERELEAIANAVRDAPSATMSQDEFAGIVEESQNSAGEAAPLLSKRLSEELLTPRPKRKLPRILYIHGLYIHASRLFSVFEQARAEMGKRLTQEYIELMEAFLRGRAPDVAEIFSSRELLNEDIGRRVGRQHPLLGELFARPQVVAEALIHDARQKREGISTEEIRTLLARYFDVEASALKPLKDLLDLSIVTIFDNAFARVGVLRQIILRISGRHESLRATYARRFGRAAHSRTSSAAADDAETTTGLDATRGGFGGHTESETVRERGSGGSRETSRGGSARSHRRRADSRQVKPRPKSRDEIERIWKDFDKALHTKPSEKESS